jgi:hypothetical protein
MIMGILRCLSAKLRFACRRQRKLRLRESLHGAAFRATLRVALAAAAANVPALALAQSVDIADISATFGSVGTTPVLVVPAIGDPRVPPSRSQLTLANSSAVGGSDISCGYSAQITLHGQGTFLIGAGAPPAFWPRGTAPSAAIYCVAAGAATPMQIVIGN